jgi:hypothetical protein
MVSIVVWVGGPVHREFGLSLLFYALLVPRKDKYNKCLFSNKFVVPSARYCDLTISCQFPALQPLQQGGDGFNELARILWLEVRR